MKKEILFTGVGGQGVVLLSRLISAAYVKKGFSIKTTETIGMAQMGGSVTSHLRISDKEIHSPFLKEESGDIVFGFEPSEVLRNSKYLNKDTIIVLHEVGIKPVTDSLSPQDYDERKVVDLIKNKFKNVYSFNFKELFKEIKSEKPMNLALLGVAIALDLIEIDEADMLDVIKENIPERFLEINLTAYNYGLNLGKNKGERNE